VPKETNARSISLEFQRNGAARIVENGGS